MGGAVNQISSVGIQDEDLTGTPEYSFFESSYVEYTPFAMESIEQTFNGQADFGRKVHTVISRNGDLAGFTVLQMTYPEINQMMGQTNYTTGATSGVYARWLDFPGEQVIAKIEVSIGGQKIDTHYGDSMHIWNQLTISAEHQRTYFSMVGNTTQMTFITDPSFADVDGPCDSLAPRQVCAPRNALPETTLYVPLQFWFCTNPGLALPLVALQFHDVKISVDFRPIDECLWAVTTLNCMTDGVAAPGKPVAAAVAYNQSMVAASIYVEYIFLGKEERIAVAKEDHSYLITQLQFSGEESVGSSSNKIKLTGSHPVKEIIWVVQPDANVDYCSSTTCDAPLFKVLGAQPFNYTDALDALPNAIHAFGGPGAVAGDSRSYIDEAGMFQDAGAIDYNPYGTDTTNNTTGYWSGADNMYSQPNFGGTTTEDGITTGHMANSGVSDAGTFVLSETSLDMHCWGQNPTVVAKLQINGQDRFSEREGSYFNKVQPFRHHTRGPDEGINVYSFAISPEEYQPSGSYNFSRIDSASLHLVLSNATVEGTKTAKVRPYIYGINKLVIANGLGGVKYAS